MEVNTDKKAEPSGNIPETVGREDEERLAREAMAVRLHAYAPYSHFFVGAALLGSNGKIYTGCNIENASYPAGICAERSAFASAVSAGCRRFLAIAIAGGPEDKDRASGRTAVLPECPPCGICRQFMREFCGNRFPVILVTSEKQFRTVTLGTLLPDSFGPDVLSL